ncbi:MAG: GNAT family N-acetyltransferase [Sphingomonadales bacterium]|nr:GNAT family N-acetyltransferase [Sphingomonadales bacterium]
MEHAKSRDLAGDSPRRLSIRLARSEEDLAAVQRLRWLVFFAEMGAGDDSRAAEPLDRDAYDALCDHLLVIDESLPGEGHVVGTYRLLRESVALRHDGFYSAGEFDLEPMIAGATGEGELLELGRSCVLPAYRTSATISLLWRGIADYIARHRIRLMFGCASFPGNDPDSHAASLSLLHHRHRAPDHLRPRVRPGMGIALDRVPLEALDERRALFQLPPLVKGYLRAGAMFGDGAFVDRDFNTIDVCVIMPVEAIVGRYAARFSVAA